MYENDDDMFFRAIRLMDRHGITYDQALHTISLAEQATPSYRSPFPEGRGVIPNIAEEGPISHGDNEKQILNELKAFMKNVGKSK